MSLSCFRINTYISVDSKGLTAGSCFGAFGPRTANGARFGKRALQPHTKKKMRQLGCRSEGLYVVVPGNDYSKIWFGLKGKKSGKDNAEVRRALRFAERISGSRCLRCKS